MKIEIGESLFYSWLRHVKDCQIVQTNWKVSPQWELSNKDEIRALMEHADNLFSQKYGYAIFKQNSLEQLLRQSECDVLGISLQHDGSIEYHSIDVAFHESGLQYGDKTATTERVIKKCLRTAMCLRGYLGASNAVIVFASPKVNPAQIVSLTPCLEDANLLLQQHGLDYHIRLIVNRDFDVQVLRPILLVSDHVADTSELFMRSYQMYQMFAESNGESSVRRKPAVQQKMEVFADPADGFDEMKVGKIANGVLRNRLEAGYATADEILLMQQKEYSKSTFGLNYPLLVEATSDFEQVRYYSRSLTIRGSEYYLCSQWFETAANNDRPFLISWLNSHRDMPE